MRVFVMTSNNGEINSYDVKEDSVKSLKEAIFLKEGNILVEHQRLTVEREDYPYTMAEDMKDEMSLSFYDVKEGSTVYYTNQRPLGRVCWGPGWKLGAFYVVRKKICRKCNGRLPPGAERCRKAKCNRTEDIRWRHPQYPGDVKSIPKKLSEWHDPEFRTT